MSFKDYIKHILKAVYPFLIAVVAFFAGVKYSILVSEIFSSNFLDPIKTFEKEKSRPFKYESIYQVEKSQNIKDLPVNLNKIENNENTSLENPQIAQPQSPLVQQIAQSPSLPQQMEQNVQQANQTQNANLEPNLNVPLNVNPATTVQSDMANQAHVNYQNSNLNPNNNQLKLVQNPQATLPQVPPAGMQPLNSQNSNVTNPSGQNFNQNLQNNHNINANNPNLQGGDINVNQNTQPPQDFQPGRAIQVQGMNNNAINNNMVGIPQQAIQQNGQINQQNQLNNSHTGNANVSPGPVAESRAQMIQGQMQNQQNKPIHNSLDKNSNPKVKQLQTEQSESQNLQDEDEAKVNKKFKKKKRKYKKRIRKHNQDNE